MLKSHGYYDSFLYTLGTINHPNLFGWQGNASLLTVEELVDDIVIIKSVDDCPDVRIGVGDGIFQFLV